MLLVLGTIAWWIVGRLSFDSHQERHLGLGRVALFTIVLLLIWLLVFSRLRWWLRLGCVAAFMLVLGLTVALVEIRGVTGDLLPIFGWRWSGAPASRSRPETSTVPAQVRLLSSPHDYPQFLGPRRSGMVTGPALAQDWKSRPPTLLWRQSVGAAWSGFAVAGAYAVTQEQRGEEECVVAYDVVTGESLWVHADPARYATTIAGEGPRATPTVVSNRVYALGATGLLNCLDLPSGQKIWTRQIITENEGKVGDWGVTSSPLVVGQLVIVSPGGKKDRTLVAYHRETGDFVRGGGRERADYSSPALVELAGQSQILIFNPSGLVSHDPGSGTILWRHGWRGGHPHITVPIVLPGDRLLISSGYGTGAEVIKVERDASWKTSQVWKSIRLKSKFANLIHRQGFIYGLDDGIMVCLDAASGELQWKEGRLGHGQLILANDLLLVLAENGELMLIDPSPKALRVLSQFPVLDGKTWNPPALAGLHLLVRNDREAVCFSLAEAGR